MDITYDIKNGVHGYYNKKGDFMHINNVFVIKDGEVLYEIYSPVVDLEVKRVLEIDLAKTNEIQIKNVSYNTTAKYNMYIPYEMLEVECIDDLLIDYFFNLHKSKRINSKKFGVLYTMYKRVDSEYKKAVKRYREDFNRHYKDDIESLYKQRDEAIENFNKAIEEYHKLEELIIEYSSNNRYISK